MSENKKATEVFKRLQKKEKQAQKINLSITLLILAENILAILVFGFFMNSNVLPEIVGMSLLVIMGILFWTVLHLSNKEIFSEPSISNEIDFINSVLKEEAKCKETEIIQAGEKQYIEVLIGSDLQLICINDGNIPEKIESCLVGYYKILNRLNYADTFFVKTMYRIFVKYQEQEEPKILKEN